MNLLTKSIILYYIIITILMMFVKSSMNRKIPIKMISPKIIYRKLFNSNLKSQIEKAFENNIKSEKNEEFIRVVTDIDDTVKSSGGVKLFGIPLGGIDRQYSRGEFYPGAFQFFYELSQFNTKKSAVPRVAVLTARAKELLFALALKPTDKLCKGFQKVGEANGNPDWGIALEHVYYGSVIEWYFFLPYQNFII